MLDQIKKALEKAFDIPVCFGTNIELDGQNAWDYIVFWREKTKWKVNSRGDYTDYYTVALVMKDYIPEDDTTKVLDALREIAGLKENGDIEYSYMVKPGTKATMEIAEYHFISARKRIVVKEQSNGNGAGND